jgi:hypothetical protein
MNDIVDKRKRTHGDYRRTARAAQAIKSVLENGDMWKFDEGFSDLARESLHLIATKMARIVEGDWSEPDHWRDISGYAELVLREIKRMELDWPASEPSHSIMDDD